MREHDALGCAGAAAGVEQLGDFVLIERENIWPFDAAMREQLLERKIGAGSIAIDGDEALDRGAGFAQRG